MEDRWGIVQTHKKFKSKGGQIYGAKGNLTFGDEHTKQYTYDRLLNCTFETYIILLTSVTPIHLIKQNKKFKRKG